MHIMMFLVPHAALSLDGTQETPISTPQTISQLHNGRRGIREQHFPFTSRRLIIKDQANPYTCSWVD